jgi:uncharacterized protein (TIGR02246 family)
MFLAAYRMRMASDEQQIKRLMEEWRRCTAAGDLDGLLALIADHAVFLTPGHGPITKAGFAAGFRKLSAKALIEARQEIKDIGVCEHWAYAWSRLTLVLTAKANGARSESSGDVLTVFRKSADGIWQLARDANLLPG